MHYLHKKDKKLRNLIMLNENKFLILKSIIKNLNLPFFLRWGAVVSLKNLNKKHFYNKTRLVNRCIITNKNSVVNKKFKLSRFELLRQIRSGNINGFKKDIW